MTASPRQTAHCNEANHMKTIGDDLGIREVLVDDATIAAGKENEVYFNDALILSRYSSAFCSTSC
jgi:hypothetical protein